MLLCMSFHENGVEDTDENAVKKYDSKANIENVKIIF